MARRNVAVLLDAKHEVVVVVGPCPRCRRRGKHEVRQGQGAGLELFSAHLLHLPASYLWGLLKPDGR